MKVIAAAWADLRTTFFGLRSRLATPLAGIPVLRRTVTRLERAGQIDGIFVLCPADQAAACRDLLHGTAAVVQPVETDPPPWAALVRAARKWSLDGWRGGIGGTTSFDEYTDARMLAPVLSAVGADAVLSVPAAAPVLDPELVDRMITHSRASGDDSRLTFTQTPPGVAGILLRADLVRELAERRIAVGWVLAYKPDDPLKDLVFQPCLCELPPALGILRYVTGRLVADTRRSFETIESLLQAHDDPNGAAIGKWLEDREFRHSGALPREVEIELTTLDPYPQNLLRPRGGRTPSRGPFPIRMVEKIGKELSAYDDSLVVLGGFGDPLRHASWPEAIRALRGAESSKDDQSPGVFGVAMRTAGVDLDEDTIEKLILSGLDVLQVQLDAWSAEHYAELHSPNDAKSARLEGVLTGLERMEAARRRHGSATPIVLPDMTKCLENVAELDAFHDGWLRKLGAVSITGYSHYGGRVPDRRVTSMSPPSRSPCRRLWSRCLVLADGTVTLCDQDFEGAHAIGQMGKGGIAEVWEGSKFCGVRDAHVKGCFEVTTICGPCDEWHRP